MANEAAAQPALTPDTKPPRPSVWGWLKRFGSTKKSSHLPTSTTSPFEPVPVGTPKEEKSMPVPETEYAQLYTTLRREDSITGLLLTAAVATSGSFSSDIPANEVADRSSYFPDHMKGYRLRYQPGTTYTSGYGDKVMFPSEGGVNIQQWEVYGVVRNGLERGEGALMPYAVLEQQDLDVISKATLEQNPDLLAELPGKYRSNAVALASYRKVYEQALSASRDGSFKNNVDRLKNLRVSTRA